MVREAEKRGVKAVLFLGDLNPHATNIEINEEISEQDRKEIFVHLKNFIYNTATSLFSRFKDKNGQPIPLYMGIGNHDTLVNHESVHSQNEVEESNYYYFLRQNFLEGEGSLARGQYDKDRTLYDEIGCYVVKDIFKSAGTAEEYLSLINLNSLIFLYRSNSVFKNEAKLALRWLEEVLKTSDINEKFILTQHAHSGKNIGVKSEPVWKAEYEAEYQRIVGRYSHKIVLSLSGHEHTFAAKLPLLFHQNMQDSILHFNLCSFSQVSHNNPVYYIIKFFKEQSVGLADIVAQEVDLSEMKTIEHSLVNYIIDELFPVKNRLMNDMSQHGKWVERIRAVINLMKSPFDSSEVQDMAQSLLVKYLMFMVGHHDLLNKSAKTAFERRNGLDLEDPYNSQEQRMEMY
jgi:hypothetical protein